jgi:hypothetical protein
MRIKREGWTRALSCGVLTSYDQAAHGSFESWRTQFAKAIVHVQWDPERSIHGKKLTHRSIQVGLSREIIREFTDEWVLEIKDLTPLVKKVRALYLAGHHAKASKQLPPEKVFPVDEEIMAQLGMIG